MSRAGRGSSADCHEEQHSCECTKEWVRGRQLQGDAAHSFSQCECLVTAPYEESEHGGKKTLGVSVNLLKNCFVTSSSALTIFSASDGAGEKVRLLSITLRLSSVRVSGRAVPGVAAIWASLASVCHRVDFRLRVPLSSAKLYRLREEDRRHLPFGLRPRE